LLSKEDEALEEKKAAMMARTGTNTFTIIQMTFRYQTPQGEMTESTENFPSPTEEQCATVTVEDLADQLEETSLQGPEAFGDIDPEPDVIDGRLSKQNDEITNQDDLEPLEVEITPLTSEEAARDHEEASTFPQRSSPSPIYDDPSDSDDGEGEWITPSNVALHKCRALDLLPEDGLKSKGKRAQLIGSGCMTADFAMQNVLLHMGLNLVGLEGKRIERIKSWVLRCHACFK
jgi:RNA-binding protein NOB1